jgi:hypothetical protein
MEKLQQQQAVREAMDLVAGDLGAIARASGIKVGIKVGW